MSEEEDYDEEGEEEEEEEGEEGEEGEDDEAAKQAAVKEDISLLLDVFAYIDRTSKRMASRLELEAAMAAPHKGPNFPAGIGMNHDVDFDAGLGGLELGGGGGGGGAGAGGGGGAYNPTWSNYENLTEAERGELLQKAIMTLGEQPREVLVQQQQQQPDPSSRARRGK